MTYDRKLSSTHSLLMFSFERCFLTFFLESLADSCEWSIGRTGGGACWDSLAVGGEIFESSLTCRFASGFFFFDLATLNIK